MFLELTPETLCEASRKMTTYTATLRERATALVESNPTRSAVISFLNEINDRGRESVALLQLLTLGFEQSLNPTTDEVDGGDWYFSSEPSRLQAASTGASINLGTLKEMWQFIQAFIIEQEGNNATVHDPFWTHGVQERWDALKRLGFVHLWRRVSNPES